MKTFSLAGVLWTSITIFATSNAMAIETLPVGNPGNTPDSTGFGEVAYRYRIRKARSLQRPIR